MRRVASFGFLSLLVTVVACSSSSKSDAGTDAAIDSGPDLCDLDLFKASGGDGHTCPQVSPRVCFPLCTTGGCKCIATASGAQWKCTTDLSCLEAGVDDGGDDDGAADSGSPDTGAGDAPAE